MRQRLRFGAFLAPHHPLGEHPTLQFQRELERGRSFWTKLQFDEFWVGEHHSAGWETIGSPEMFLVAAAERTQRIRLGTGVISVPYHHPFNIAQRIVHLDHLSRGRAILGVGPGALPSDAVMLGIDPSTQRDRMDEGLGVVLRLLNEDEPITVRKAIGSRCTKRPYNCDRSRMRFRWPLPHRSLRSRGMKAAGKYGVGVLSIASYLEEGLTALPTQWSWGETSAREHGQRLDRADWRIVMPFHLVFLKGAQPTARWLDGLQRLAERVYCRHPRLRQNVSRLKMAIERRGAWMNTAGVFSERPKTRLKKSPTSRNSRAVLGRCCALSTTGRRRTWPARAMTFWHGM